MRRDSFYLFFFLLYLSPLAYAEIDKVYHPYVEAYKKELEYRTLYKNDNNQSHLDGLQVHSLSFAMSLTEQFSLEAYVIARNPPMDRFSVSTFELEAIYQLTEQGEYWADWGLLFELERDTALNKWEGGVSLLSEKQWGRWNGTINFSVDYEYGSGIQDEFETVLHSQIKYRASPLIEPAIELYMDEETRGIGPALLGTVRTGHNKLKWELGVIFGFNGRTANENVRFLLDYEF